MESKMKVLITGGLGFIGSHIAVALLNEGHDVVIYDSKPCGNSVRSHHRLDAIWKCTKFREARLATASLTRHFGNVRDYAALSDSIDSTQPDAIIHCAGLKSSSEGSHPAHQSDYTHTNVIGTQNVAALAAHYGINRVIFSSTASLYCPFETMPVSESSAVVTSDHHASTKHTAEGIIKAHSGPHSYEGIVLRYSNPIGAHERGYLIDESTTGLGPAMWKAYKGDRIMPVYMANTAHGLYDDFAHSDGSTIRDYVHVMDLAEAHIAALMDCEVKDSFEVFNVGYGDGNTTLAVVNEVNEHLRYPLRVNKKPAKLNDMAVRFIKTKKFNERTGWHATRGLETMARDHVNAFETCELV